MEEKEGVAERGKRRRWSTFLSLARRGEQSSVITEITDQKPKLELEPNRTALIRSGFSFVFQNPNPTEPNFSPYISPYSNSIW